jgi:hypothetical protein
MTKTIGILGGKEKRCKNCGNFHYDQEIGHIGWGLCSYILSEKGLIRNPRVLDIQDNKYMETRVFVHEKFYCIGWIKRNA